MGFLRKVLTEPLTPEGFAPFGDVISAGLRSGTNANQGTAIRFDRSADLENRRDAAAPNLAVFSASPRALPLKVKVIERHPYSTQAFLPMVCSRFLVCVAPTLPDGEPDLAGLRAFVCGPGQGVNYRPGVWHHGIVALDAPAEFAMLSWEDGTPGDCEERWVEEAGLALVDSLTAPGA